MEPFVIPFSQPEHDDLRKRLRNTRWPDQVQNAGWKYGTELSYLKQLCDYWIDVFDWKKQLEYLNSFHHYHVAIDNCTIHFIYERSTESDATPIVISHGWPSSFAEMLKIIPMLTDPARFGGTPEDAFDVIVPSLPGFAFSTPRPRGHMRAHELWAKLMTTVLGYDSFIAQGTDVGAGVTSLLGYFFPKLVKGIHISSVDLLWPVPMPAESEMTANENRYLASFEKWDEDENGYGHIQRTKPQTLAYGLNDSPMGLAAWIVEKFRSWSDCNGNIESRFTKDELLTNIMIYWTTQAINSSMRHYYDHSHNINLPQRKQGDKIKVPTGVAMFPGEKDLIVPREFAERSYNIQRWTDMPSGGHFAAMEEPELLVNDIREFARSLR